MRIVHFELPADDPKRCMAFYTGVFGWTFDKWDGPTEYWMVKTGEGAGIDGGLMARQRPGQQPNNVIAVASVDDVAKAIVAAGGVEVAPKMTIPGIGYAAYFLDTEQNAFGVIQFDERAK